jgi:hypothetical protein
LKRESLRAKELAQTFMADVVDHPLGDQEVGQLGQAPGRERQVMIHRPGQSDLLDLRALRQGERRGTPAGIAREQAVEPVDVEVVDHIPDPVRAGERDPGDRRPA